MLPLFCLVFVVVWRDFAGESLRVDLMIAAPVLGVGFAAYCHVWLLMARRTLDRELAERSRQLEGSRRFLAEVVDASPGALLISDLEGNITFASAAAERLFGADAGALDGMAVGRLYAEGAPGALTTRRRLREGGGALHAHRATLRRVTGTEFPGEVSAVFLHGSDGREDAVLAVVADLTERIAGERRALDIERLRVLGESVAGIAHELNNPLTGVIGYLQLVLEDESSGDRREALLKASREAERMARTIRSLLSFSRRRGPERQLLDLNEIVRQVCEFREYQLRVNDVRVEFEPGVLPEVFVDPDQLRQVVMNLLKNAEDAIRDSGVGGLVVLRTATVDGFVRVEVRDDGPGIPREIEDRIFEHFFTTKPVGKGTGLGLAICRQIVESHGGRILLERPGARGVSFVVELPKPRSDGAAVTVRVPEAALPRAEGLRARVVDDEEAVRDYVVAVLESDGHSASEAGTGAEALMLAEGGEFDLVFLDRGLPDMRGEACRAEMCRLRPALTGRVVLMSGDLPDEDPGPNFLLKPMTPEEILDAAARAAHPADAVA